MAENDQLANYLRAIGGLGGRRQSLQSRLAEQMMAGLQNQTPIYSTGAAVARAGEGLLAGLMAKSANDAETKREDELYQRGIDRQDEQRLRDKQEAQDFQERFFPAARSEPENSVPAPINMPTTSTNDTFLNTLERYESNGDSTPNPRSSAAGNFQFIDDTWRAFARANPDRFPGMDDAAILAARSDPQLGRQAAQWYASENSRYLADQNLPNSYPEQALAHGFGPVGAAAILRAAPDALVVNAVPNGDRVLAANPNLRDVTVQDYLARNNARYGAAFTNPSGSQPSEVQNLLAGYRAASGAAPAGPPQASADGTVAPVAAPTAAPAGAPARAPAGAPLTSQANPDLMKAYIAAASSANPQIRAMAPAFLAQINRQDILAARVDPTVETDGQQGPGIYTRDAKGKLTFVGPRLPPQEGAETFTGAPQIVMQDGQQVLVQTGNRGTVRRIEGFGPRNDGPYQGNSIEAQDSNVLLRGDPASAEYAAAWARQATPRINADGSTVTPNMQAYRLPTYNPNLPAAPAIAPNNFGGPPAANVGSPTNFAPIITDATKPTADQSKVSTFAARMAAANVIIGNVGTATTGVVDRIADQIPGVGNYFTSPNFQIAKQAQADFINAVLRRESGAVISDSEFENAAKQYFPQPGDGPKVLEQKRQNREITLLGFEREAGPARQPRPNSAQSTNVIIFGSDGKRKPQ